MEGGGEKKKPPNLRLEDGGADFRKLFVPLINEPGQCLCVRECVRGLEWYASR